MSAKKKRTSFSEKFKMRNKKKCCKLERSADRQFCNKIEHLEDEAVGGDTSPSRTTIKSKTESDESWSCDEAKSDTGDWTD